MKPEQHRQLNTILVVMLLMVVGTLYYIVNHKIEVPLEHCEERLYETIAGSNNQMYRDLFKEIE